MDIVLRPRSLSLEITTSDTCSPATSEDQPASVKHRRNYKISKSTDKCKRSKSSTTSYIVDYGPIRIRHRQTASRTIATGRRPRDAVFEGAKAIEREIRREKNRVAARELKKTRDQIEFNLVNTIKELEEEKDRLVMQYKDLEEQKAQLTRAVYNAKQAPLIPFITDMNIPVFIGLQHQNDLLIDLQPLLKCIDEHCSLSDF